MGPSSGRILRPPGSPPRRTTVRFPAPATTCVHGSRLRGPYRNSPDRTAAALFYVISLVSNDPKILALDKAAEAELIEECDDRWRLPSDGEQETEAISAARLLRTCDERQPIVYHRAGRQRSDRLAGGL